MQKILNQDLIQFIFYKFKICTIEIDEKEYRKFIETTPKLKEYDDLMFSISENQISYKLLEEVYKIVNNKLYLNVKTDPNYSDILRNTYDYIIPAYHMNKEHWNTIIIDEKVDEDLVKELIEQSYQLTK